MRDALSDRMRDTLGDRRDALPDLRDRLASIDADQVTEYVPAAFYVLMGVALIAAMRGANGFAFVVLLLGAALHVARVGLEDARR